jgi:asparagine synthase (glutamine-hydrolysing)
VCGICGKLNFDSEAGVSKALLKAMADTIAHRGPDDDGYYVSGPVGLGFRRLSIIDLGGGHQPLSNEDGTVWIVFNGEIYNYQELRAFLVTKGHVFRTQSDTEVIVHLYEEEGEACVKKLRGMFGFAIWDERQRKLMLARDRVGIKPLYYGVTDRSLVFGSEMKAILADPEIKRELNTPIIDRFLTFDFVPGEETLLRNIYKLPPGSYLVAKDGKREIKQYWDLDFTTSSLSFEEARAQLLEMLKESVRLHMISDVPVGFLLSGGVDSTAMLSLASQEAGREFSSFTVGFSNSGIDERPYARLAAKKYGSRHHEITISSKEFVDFLPRYVHSMEEPVCEPPAIALYYVSKLARNHVKVLISGEGGDEAFAGYPNYRGMKLVENLKRLPGALVSAVSGTLGLINSAAHSERIRNYRPLLKTPFDSYYFSRTSTPFRFFNASFKELYTPDFLRSVDKEYSLQPVRGLLRSSQGHDVVSRMLYVDSKTWLPDDLLIKADKITMANSVELRVPLLDHKILEFAASLPSDFKVRGMETKYIAKNSLKDLVPAEILHRKKAGFPVPYAEWLRTDLRSWIQNILMDRKTLDRNYFQKKTVERLLHDNLKSGSYPKEIFSLAVLELWHREFLDSIRTAPLETHPALPEYDAART